MPALLHILTRADDPLARNVIDAQRADPSNAVAVVDWTRETPDLDELLDQIFAADSIATW